MIISKTKKKLLVWLLVKLKWTHKFFILLLGQKAKSTLFKAKTKNQPTNKNALLVNLAHSFIYNLKFPSMVEKWSEIPLLSVSMSLQYDFEIQTSPIKSTVHFATPWEWAHLTSLFVYKTYSFTINPTYTTNFTKTGFLSL